MSAIKLSHVVTSLVFTLLLAGCAAPTPEFTDPLAGLGRSADNRSDFAHLTLGLILSENAEKSMEYLRENRAKFDIPLFANQAGAADLDPAYLTSGLNDVLARRFRDVIRLDDFDSARSTNTDIVLLLDIRTEIGGMSFKTTSVQISGIFLNDNQKEIGRVEGTGAKKVPYPASTFQFKAATNEALTNFSGNLDGDPDLATTLNASVLERVAAASLPAAPSQSERNWTFGSGSGFGTYHALVIGNNHYRSLPQLRTAIADAESVATTLAGRYGFNVAILADATRADILRALNQLRRTLTPGDNLLIYYAGHGWLDEDAGQGYWLPIDADREDPTNWVSNASITDAVRALQAKHVMVVADSCYSGSLTRGVSLTVQTPNYLERMANKKARTVLTSGGLEPVLDDGGGGHSVFASAFLAALNENMEVMDGHTLFSRIRRPVMVNSLQTPEYGDIRLAGHDGGDFLFVPGGSPEQ